MPNNRPLLGLTNLISRGISPKYDTQGYLVLNQRCIRNHRIEYETARITNKNKSKINPEKFIRKWDVLINSTGVGTLGRVAQVLESQDNVTVDSHVSIARPKLEMLDGRYFGYALIEREPYIETLGKGATGQTELSRQSISEVTISFHSLPKQIKIASILSAYDDLIENNLQRIKILEEMAKMLYREWFVNFRFPGHEKVKMVDSALGKIPDGWEVRNLFEVAEVTYGFPFKSKLFTTDNTDSLPVIRIRDILNNESSTYTPEQAHDKHIVINGDILVGMDGNFHMGQWAGNEAYLNQRVVRFRPLYNLPTYYLFWALEKPIHFFNSTITGTTVAHLGDKHLRTIEIMVPSKKIVEYANRVLNPLYELKVGLRLKNRILRKTRALLLPKLISGEIDAEKMDIAS